ncbi:hypothetical protein SEVIR_6G079300v4 [Setaria viridis]|uniref:Protein kinase domain-containing protein n=1 Tax=Setaria viridis TaxID=4556 RepID=A0A4U6U758_SETVI|nr:wall-associated receptor kinase 1-like isoform X2 [Setaria viridis]TKW09219.1 hypothetical protein SEVIR_6G079300v2 [Setaria viridis]
MMKLFSLQFYLLLFVFTEQASGVLTSQDGNNTHPYFPSAMLAGNCPSRCGNLTFDYPFGIGSGCYRDPDFSLTCDDTVQPPRLYLQDSTTEVTNDIDASTYGSTSFMNFSVQIPSLSIPIRQGVVVYDMSWKAPAFTLDHVVLNITGCDLDTYWIDQATTTWKLCTVTCPDAKITDKVARENCNGTGCCSIEFDNYLSAIQLKFVVNRSRELTDHSALQDTINVNYASASISWSIMDQPTCATALDNVTTYACVSSNSVCYNSHFTSHPGYHCGCEDGYSGNSYIPNGCSRDKGYNPIQQKVNCQRNCGNISIPFPFGLEEGCSATRILQLNCTNSTSTLQFDEEHQVTHIDIYDGIVDIRYTPQQMFRVDALKEPGLYLVSSSVQWVVANLTCQEAKLNSSEYGCVSINSNCLGVNSTDGYIGYRCKCESGFLGNPYIQDGCEDIDECSIPNRCYGICHNYPGGYNCISCPPKTMYDPVKLRCTHIEEEFNIVLPGVSIAVVLLVVTLSGAYLFHQKRRLAAVKKRYFKQHGGLLLLEEMKSKQGLSFTLFTKAELGEATGNFDERNVLGKGGNGTVYKGTLKDNRSVAIKKCKMISERQEKEFGKEMLILSQINHRNVVKLYGCCLEVEVPMLVYEFIPNGTLYQLIQGRHHHGPRVSFATRLKIAHEAAEALAYLHSSASPPIIHGDVKSANILIDDNYTVKVSDFGASTLAPTDEAQFVTFVQGTYGYLDPEYMQTSKLTSKSDVYSFGVVILELLTCRKATNLQAIDEEINLSAHFLLAMSENRLGEILDEQIKGEESIELIEQLAELARRCLEMASEQRPPMREVADELERFRNLSQHPWGQETSDEGAMLVGSPNACFEIELSNGYVSMTDSAYLGIQSPR